MQLNIISKNAVIIFISALTLFSCEKNNSSFSLTEDSSTPAGFSEGQTSKSASITPVWSKNSPAAIIDVQTIDLYDNSSCSGSFLFSIAVGGEIEQVSVTVNSSGTYSYKLNTKFKSGKNVESNCSPSIVVNLTPLPPVSTATTVVLVRCEGGGLVDLQGHAITNTGVTLSTAQTKFGTESCYFDGGSAYLDFGTSPDFNLGINDFTAEAWVYTVGMGSYIATCSRYGWGVQGFSLQDGYGIIGNQQLDAGGYVTPITVPQNQWVHVALERYNGTLTYYINGVSMGATTQPASDMYSQSLVMGRISIDQSSYYNNGYMEEMRISNGARYKGPFTPPSAPFTP
ncbi:MAG: LamG domain-containing protein [Bdellovibrio sp.]|nr:LamG domain-containing protein [Bdellovibrio sp.]